MNTYRQNAEEHEGWVIVYRGTHKDTTNWVRYQLCHSYLTQFFRWRLPHFINETTLGYYEKDLKGIPWVEYWVNLATNFCLEAEKKPVTQAFLGP